MHLLLLLLSSTGQPLCKCWNLALPRHLENMPTKSSSHTSSVSFVVYHVSISFGIVIKTTPWRQQHWRNDENGVWWALQSYQENWQSFLLVDASKDELFTFRSAVLVQFFESETKKPVVTDGEAVICFPRHNNESYLAPHSHEEADTRIKLHAAPDAKTDHRRVQVRTVGTNVVVLAVMVSAVSATLHTPNCRGPRCHRGPKIQSLRHGFLSLALPNKSTTSQIEI